MIHLVHFASGSDIFSLGGSAIGKFTRLIGLAFVLFIGLKAAGHVARDKPLAALAIVVVALIPAYFIFDPVGATHTLKSTVAAL